MPQQREAIGGAVPPPTPSGNLPRRMLRSLSRTSRERPTALPPIGILRRNSSSLSTSTTSSSQRILLIKRTPEDLSEEALRESATCPVCLEPAPVPILQCTNGHTLCEECQQSGIESCPQCRVELFPLSRNVALEERLEKITFACPLECGKCVAHPDLSDHVARCENRSWRCPLSASAHCDWHGRCDQIEAHVMTAHSAIRGNCGQIKVVRHKSKKLSESRRTHVLTFRHDGAVFVAYLFCRKKTLYAYVQQIDRCSDDNRFAWSLTFYGRDVVETRHSRRCSTKHLNFNRHIDPLTTLATPPPDDDTFDLALSRETRLPASLLNNQEAMSLQSTSRSMWCIAFRIHAISNSDKSPQTVAPSRPPPPSPEEEEEEEGEVDTVEDQEVEI